MATYQGRDFGKALIDEGLIPPNARLLELVVPVSGAVILRLEVLVEKPDFDKIVRAIQSIVAPAGPAT